MTHSRPPLRVAYDSRGASDPRGIGRYVRSLRDALRRTATDGDELIETSRPRRVAVYHSPWIDGAQLRPRGPMVVTLHDLIPLKRRGEYLRTGLRYRLVNDDIEAMLAFKLDPALAREFGKQGIDAVVRAEGMLVDAEISGEDVGAKITAGKRDEGNLEEELKRVEAQLARPGLRGSERAELQIQAQELRERMRGSRDARLAQQEQLATTPMTFNYGSGDLAPGFGGRPSFGRAWNDAIDNFLGGLAWIFVALITLLPWALLAGALVWGGRKLARRFSPGPDAPPEA